MQLNNKEKRESICSECGDPMGGIYDHTECSKAKAKRQRKKTYPPKTYSESNINYLVRNYG